MSTRESSALGNQPHSNTRESSAANHIRVLRHPNRQPILPIPDIGCLMKQHAEKEDIMVQPRRMPISSFILTYGTTITLLFLFYLKLGLVCNKIHLFVQYTPRKGFINFVESAVDAGRHGDETSNSSVVAETMKLLANNS